MQRELENAFDVGFDGFMEDWKAFIRYPSVSAAPEHDDDCRACASWLEARLQAIGFRTEQLETAGKPVIYGHLQISPVAETILLYGHYDVQPADPHAEWDTPPFEPTLKGSRLFGRGAQDNKGQLTYCLKAIETLARTGSLPVNVKVLIEGEEESGGGGITDGLPRWRDRLQADALLVADTGMAKSGAPAITMGLRGLVHLSVRIDGPRYDLHSGMHGGVAPNPAAELARLVASLHDTDGRIAVDGYYEGVAPITDTERRLANSATGAERAYEAETGTPPCAGEDGFTIAERLGFRPSLDVNGIHTGYEGPSVKTIIPARARAWITGRVAAGQNPARCLQLLTSHFEQNVGHGFRLQTEHRGVGGPALRVNPDSTLVRRAHTVLTDICDREPEYVWEGASIPIIPALAEAAGAEPLLVGFGKEEDRIHSPNESFSLEQFKQGFLYIGSLLAGWGHDA